MISNGKWVLNGRKLFCSSSKGIVEGQAGDQPHDGVYRNVSNSLFSFFFVISLNKDVSEKHKKINIVPVFVC